jgi:hypothetical protein
MAILMLMYLVNYPLLYDGHTQMCEVEQPTSNGKPRVTSRVITACSLTLICLLCF